MFRCTDCESYHFLLFRLHGLINTKTQCCVKSVCALSVRHTYQRYIKSSFVSDQIQFTQIEGHSKETFI